jgi:hypothetical protein
MQAYDMHISMVHVWNHDSISQVVQLVHAVGRDSSPFHCVEELCGSSSIVAGQWSVVSRSLPSVLPFQRLLLCLVEMGLILLDIHLSRVTLDPTMVLILMQEPK